MSGFLHSLAGVALGGQLPGRAVVSLPSRFVTLAAVATIERESMIAADSDQAAPDGATPRPTATRLADDEPAQGQSARDTGANPVAPRHDRRQLDLLAAPTDAPSVPTGGLVDRPLTVQLPKRIERRSPNTSRPMQSSPPLDRAAAPVRPPLLAASTRRSDAMPAIQAIRTDRALASHAAAPLSDAAMAERGSRASPSQPVIHVTIDRIDVRAAATAKPAAAARRERRAPTVSLTDYLRRDGAGGRS